MLDKKDELSVRKQAELLGVSRFRSNIYYMAVIDDDGCIANLIRDIYLESDCRYGYRKIVVALRLQGQIVNNKKVIKIMSDLGIKGLTPKRYICTTTKDSSHKVYPYLLKGLSIKCPNHVWATDITYIKLKDRFMYFIAIVDICSRYIIAHDLSHSLEAGFCITTLQAALASTKPEIFNTDQGVQFTSAQFVGELTKHNIQISMDHKGRCFDNIFVERLWRTIKQEAVYFYRPETVADLEKCLNNFVIWYNNKRLHQSLNYRTPSSVYHSCSLREAA
jgi:putative transposase